MLFFDAFFYLLILPGYSFLTLTITYATAYLYFFLHQLMDLAS